jgi:tetratricopeptide (TPR) repeat protein
MKQGKLWLIIGVGFVVSMLFYFLINPSYERSIESKFYFAIGEYEEAHRLASEAFILDPYNRMAATVMTQSKTALVFVDYVDQAKAYMKQISEIAESKSITEAQKAKMRLMCQIMMDSYVKISPIKRDGRTMVLDEALLSEAKSYYDQFVELHEKLAPRL